MQTNLLTFFSQPPPAEQRETSSKEQLPREDDPISEVTKECTTEQQTEEEEFSQAKNNRLFESSDDDGDLSAECLDSRADYDATQPSQPSHLPTQPSQQSQASQSEPVASQQTTKSNARRRSFTDTTATERKRRRNEASETERESISPSADCVRTVPPQSQGELPNAPRKFVTTNRSGSSIHELSAILKDEGSFEDLLDDTLLNKIDQLDLRDCQGQPDREQLEDISEHHESATRCVEDILQENCSKNSESELVFDKALLPTPPTNSDDSLLNHYLYQIPHLRDNLMWTKFIEMYYRYKTVFCIPSWINPQRMRDSERRPVEDANFDFSHIIWPGNYKSSNDDKMHFTPAMMQYWEIKTQNFDSIIFFKLGKFYELFYTDSMIAQELLGLKWMGNDSKSHVGFPESSLTSYGKQLVDFGFRVCVVEQMETPDELHQRKSISACDDQAVRRSICEIYTKGTLTHEKMLGALPSYLVSLYLCQHPAKPKEWQLAIIALDVACCQGYFRTLDENESGFYHIRNFIAQWPPREVILDAAASTSDDLTKMRTLIMGLDNPPVITKGPNSAQRVQTRLLGEDRILSLFENQEPLVTWARQSVSEAPLRSLEQLIAHLDKTLLTERIIKYSRFNEFPDQQNYLAINSASIHTLDLMPGLFSVINYTSTKFGQRMLRQWLGQPLLSKPLILGRQKAIASLLADARATERLRKALVKLPDLERQFARLSSQILRQKDSGSQSDLKQQGPVYFSETISKRISEFISFVKNLITLEQIISDLRQHLAAVDRSEVNRLLEITRQAFRSDDLQNLTESILADVDEIKCVPKPGVDSEFDSASADVAAKEAEIQEYLKSGELWRDLGVKRVSADYISSKYRFEVEITEADWKKISAKSDAQMTSTRKGWVRFHTTFIRSALSELVRLEAERDLCLYPWLGNVIRTLNLSATLICHSISLIAELDCFSSLAQYAEGLKAKTFPLIEDDSSETFIASFKKCYHPILAHSQSNFIPNDIDVIAGKPIVLTGPNMGGKSTLSRQVALLVILTQIGSAIPAQGPCRVSLFDKVFTRIGLKDALAQAKSTFLIELEDIYEMIQQAGPKSLLVIDEFGRGTNSKEGALLASSTLHYIAKHLKSACLFSTHFPIQHILDLMAENNAADRAIIKSIQHKHLGSFISNDILVFTYKLADGVFPESHGIRVAEIAGIPKSVLRLGDPSIAV